MSIPNFPPVHLTNSPVSPSSITTQFKEQLQLKAWSFEIARENTRVTDRALWNSSVQMAENLFQKRSVHPNYHLVHHKNNLFHLVCYLYLSNLDHAIPGIFFDNLELVIQRVRDNTQGIQHKFHIPWNALLSRCELPSPPQEGFVQETHHHLEQVCFISFADEMGKEHKICYKPRDMRGEAAIFSDDEPSYFSSLNRALANDAPTDNAQRLVTLSYLIPKEGYEHFGFMEYVIDATEQLVALMKLQTPRGRDRERLAYTFHNLGILEGVCRHCRVIDLHVDNVMTISFEIKNGQLMPVVIDGELYEDRFRNDESVKTRIIEGCTQLLHSLKNKPQLNDDELSLKKLCESISKTQFMTVDESRELSELLSKIEENEDCTYSEIVEELIIKVEGYWTLFEQMTSLLDSRSGYVGQNLLGGQGWEKWNPDFLKNFLSGLKTAKRITLNKPPPLKDQLPSGEDLIDKNWKRRCALMTTGELIKLRSSRNPDEYVEIMVRNLKDKPITSSIEFDRLAMKRALERLILQVDVPIFYMDGHNKKLYLEGDLVGQFKD